MLKVNENPPLIWPQAESIRQFPGQWWVAHTKSRNEKALAHDLMAKNVSYFLPMTWKVRQPEPPDHQVAAAAVHGIPVLLRR